VSIQRLSIKEFLHQSKNKVLLDVRSPAEYNHAHIPNAISIPLFTDEERKIVGTAYKQQSRQEAIKIGLDFFGPKMKKMVEEVEAISSKQLAVSNSGANSKLPTSKFVFLYCWRGGMRSAAVAWLLDLYGFKVFTLAGGYKAFRNQVLQSFEQSYEIKILGGYTGSGKTEVLQQLEKLGENVIDLEALACHKGSAFGSYKMPAQPRQEMFENLLAQELWNKSMVNGQWSTEEAQTLNTQSPLWLEDESQRIGNLNIPAALWKQMRTAPIVFLEIPFEERLNHITEEYTDCDTTVLVESVQRISKRLGPLQAKTTIEFFETGNRKEAFRILLQYYDKSYLKGLHNRENLSSLLTMVPCETVIPGNAQLLTKYQPA
jgi:tRNA 2-selenouridine synthase